MPTRAPALTFRVSVCGKVLEKECSWNDIQKFKEKVKVFCHWKPQEKVWAASVEEILKHPAEALKIFKEVFGGEGEDLILELRRKDEELRDREAERGKLILLPAYGDGVGWRLLKRCASRRTVTIEGEPVNYFEVDVEAALETVIEWGAEPEESSDALLDVLAYLDPSLTLRQRKLVQQQAEVLKTRIDAFVVLEWGLRGALVIAPASVRGDVISALQSTFTVDYYRQKMGMNGVELVSRPFRLVKVLSGRVLKAPYATIPLVERMLEESGFRVIENVRWPLTPKLAVNQRFSLYTFQEEALNAWRRAGYRGTIVMPTGAGKTFVALAAIAELQVPTLVCVTTVELAKQWVKRIRECLGLRAGVLAGGEKRLEPVTVATYHSAVRALPEIHDKFGFIVFDEGHHVPAETFKELALRAKYKYTMVLSATPQRSDRNESLIYKVCGEPVYSTSYYSLVVRGLLAPLKIEVVPVQLDADEATKYAEVSEESVDSKRVARLIQIASCAKAKLGALKRIISLEKGKVIVFCQFIDQAEKAYDAVREVEPRAALVTGSTPKGERIRSFEGFKKGDVRVLVATSVLDEGIDVPDADVAVILSGTGQVRQMIQRVGRVLRWTPGKVAKVYEVIAAGTIEEALSKSRSIFKLINRFEVEAALEVALKAYERMTGEISKFVSVSYPEREKMLEDLRALYAKLAAEISSARSLLRY